MTHTDPICTVDVDGYCERHQSRHTGEGLTRALEDTPRGVRFRRLNDRILASRIAAAANPRSVAVSAIPAAIVKDAAGGTKVVAARSATTPAGGPGTELKKTLAGVGLLTTPSCPCNATARRMDGLGVAGCRGQLDKLAGVLRENAKQFGLSDWATAGAKLVAAGIVTPNPLNLVFDRNAPFRELIEYACKQAEAIQAEAVARPTAPAGQIMVGAVTTNP